MLHHVLVIDDEKEVRDVIRLQLGGTRYELVSKPSSTFTSSTHRRPLSS
jgi:CheY-like chemotaxis protein